VILFAPSLSRALVPVAVGALVTVILAAFRTLHEPAGIELDLPVFAGPLVAKVWLATGGFVLALGQLFFGPCPVRQGPRRLRQGPRRLRQGPRRLRPSTCCG
jgi:hypothetical protein